MTTDSLIDPSDPSVERLKEKYVDGDLTLEEFESRLEESSECSNRIRNESSEGPGDSVVSLEGTVKQIRDDSDNSHNS